MMFCTVIRRSLKSAALLTLTGALAIAGLELSTSHIAHANGPIVVNSLSDDQSGGSCSQPNITCLREAISAAGATPGGATITFAVLGTITIGSTLVIDSIPANPITIDGTGSYPGISVAISGGNTMNYQNGVQIMRIGIGTPSTVTINSVLLENGSSAQGNGGAIENNGTLTVTDCAFIHNYASGIGGAISNESAGNATINTSSFVDNFVTNYGGAVGNANTMLIENSTFNLNQTSLEGITYAGAVVNKANMTITNSTFTQNTSNVGGAIVSYGGQTTVSNSTISGNIATYSGGGIENLHTLNLFSDIVAGNTITNHDTGDGGPDVHDGASSYGFNLIGDGTLSGIIANTGDVIGTSSNPINSYLGPLQDNGGLSYTMALLSPISPAIQAGDCAGAASSPIAPAVSQDQRGDNRKHFGFPGHGCDIGAYESNLTAITATATSSTLMPTASSTATSMINLTLTAPPAVKQDTIGVYRGGSFYLRLQNNTGSANAMVGFNPPGKNFPIVGDWTGSGFDSVGVFNQNSGNFMLCTTNTTASCALTTNQIGFILGNPNDTPLSGRWSSTATHAGVGVYRPTNGILYLKTVLTTGNADNAMVMGVPGDEGVAGDWTSKGFDSPGIYRPAGITFYLSNQVTNGVVFADLTATYGNATDLPITGDWIAQGHDGIGMFRATNGFVYLRNTITAGFADNSFFYGISGDVPVAGHWQIAHLSVAPLATASILIPKTATATPRFAPIAPNGGSVPGGNGIGG